jgi:hypothetical protein
MADEQTEEKTKKTVPGLVRTPAGVADHAQSVQDMQWDKERKVFRDPVIAMLALFTYAKVTAALLGEAETKLNIRTAALEKRIAEFETRVTTMERWKNEIEAQNAAMIKDFEEKMERGEIPLPTVEDLQKLKSLGVVPEAPPPNGTPEVAVLPAPEKKAKKAEKNGGAA